jgi:Ca2+-transporting ATPase
MTFEETRSETAVQTLPRLDVYAELGTSPRGLSQDEVSARLAKFGLNELPKARGRPLVFRFFEQFTDLFAVVLIAASALTFVAFQR